MRSFSGARRLANEAQIWQNIAQLFGKIKISFKVTELW